VVISVLDDGTGMPPELVAAPFEPGRRPRPSNGVGRGPGDEASNQSGNGPSNGSTNGASNQSSNQSSNGSSNGSSHGASNREGAWACSRKSAGAGLGLSIARGIVQAHGGRIELIPLRKGTCFSVHLPVEAEVLDASRLAGSLRVATGSDGADGHEPAGHEPAGPEPAGPEPAGHELAGHELAGHELAGHEPARDGRRDGDGGGDDD
jgi:hypothetical protein